MGSSIRQRRLSGTTTKLLSGLLGVGLLFGCGAAGVGFVAACNGSLDTFPTLAGAQHDLNPSGAAAATAQPTGSGVGPASVAAWLKELPRSVGYVAITELLRFKRNDAVVYPAHVWLARGLGAANCQVDAVRLQWLKAGIHASGPEQVDAVARALDGTVQSDADRRVVEEAVRSTAERESWSAGAASLRRKLAP